MSAFALRVYGTPKPQGSSTAFVTKRPSGTYTATVTESDPTKRKAMWRSDVVHAVRRAIDDGSLVPYGPGEPVVCTLGFVLPRLATMPKRKRSWPTKRNADLDKLCRGVLDALTVAGAWNDDAQVVRLHALKRYAETDERPGCEIVIETLPAWTEQPELVLGGMP